MKRLACALDFRGEAVQIERGRSCTPQGLLQLANSSSFLSAIASGSGTAKVTVNSNTGMTGTLQTWFAPGKVMVKSVFSIGGVDGTTELTALVIP